MPKFYLSLVHLRATDPLSQHVLPSSNRHNFLQIWLRIEAINLNDLLSPYDPPGGQISLTTEEGQIE
jgi:hypothetical protein